MAVDKKEILMWTAGTLASVAVAFLIYRLQKNDAAQAQQNEIDASNAEESALANQQSEAASLPSISVPAISATPSTTDTTNQQQTPALDPNLAALLTSFLSEDQTPVTQTTTPIATIQPITIPDAPTIAAVNVPTVNNFSSNSSANNQPYLTSGLKILTGAE